MSDRNELFAIGELARRTGMSVRTIRFWSDAGLTPPTTRSRTGYRLYDAEAVARLDLVRTMRDLGLGLDIVKRVLQRQTTVAEVAEVHAQALDAEILTLRVRRAVLRSVARRGSSTEEMTIMHKMAKLSAAERQHLIDEFVDKVFEGVPADAPGASLSASMRMMPATLPDDPTTAQVDAWVELAELVADAGFQARCREMAVGGAAPDSAEPALEDLQARVREAQPALETGLAPDSARAAEIIAGIVPAGTDHSALADRLELFTDARVERYWTLLGILNGWPPQPAQVPSWQWLIQALRAA